MKTQIFKQSIIIILINFLLLTSAYSANDEYSKDLHKEYKADKNTLLVIENKYGDVNIKNWDKNQVLIDVKITVEESKQNEAKELLKYINVSFSKEGNTIKSITNIDEKLFKQNSLFSFKFNSTEFSIDYNIKAPKYINLDLENKYGNAFINELSGHVMLSIKYGNVRVNKLERGNTKPLNELYLAYSNADIEECNWLKLKVKYSKIEIEKSKALVAVTSYSKMYFSELSTLACEAKYDKYEIGNINNFVGSSAYTDFKFRRLNKKLILETKYGGCRVEEIPSSFNKIKIDNKYGGIKLNINENASYQINGEAKYGSIDYPDTGRVSRIQETTETQVSGIVGKNKNTQSTVEISTKYGSVKL
jgi:hypothetical protein